MVETKHRAVAEEEVGWRAFFSDHLNSSLKTIPFKMSYHYHWLRQTMESYKVILIIIVLTFIISGNWDVTHAKKE